MSVIVKGMEMPECCQECEGLLVGEWNEYDEMCDACHYVLSEHPWEPKYKEIDDIDTSKSRPDWCPLHPLPEKHGRLIDADDFSAVMKERQLASAKWLREAKDAETINRADAVFAFLCEVKLTIGKLPTIVEAEGE